MLSPLTASALSYTLNQDRTEISLNSVYDCSNDVYIYNFDDRDQFAFIDDPCDFQNISAAPSGIGMSSTNNWVWYEVPPLSCDTQTIEYCVNQAIGTYFAVNTKDEIFRYGYSYFTLYLNIALDIGLYALSSSLLLILIALIFTYIGTILFKNGIMWIKRSTK